MKHGNCKQPLFL